MCFVVGLCPDPLRRLAALPEPPSWIKRGGNGESGREGGERAEGKGKDPQCLKCVDASNPGLENLGFFRKCF